MIAIKRIRDFLIDVIYPEEAVCLVCGAVVQSGCVCNQCRAELRREDTDVWKYRNLDGVPAFSLRAHRGPARALVLALKHQADACAANELAALLHPIPGLLTLTPETVVTWVTMPARRRRERGIDHGKLLAEAFARELGLPCRQLLTRRDDRSQTQASLARQDRQANLRSSYAPKTGIDFPVLLVDDVLTTGTTALRCVDALQRGGAKDITVITATYAIGKKHTVK